MSDITRSEAIKQLRLLKADITNGLSFVSKTKDKNLSLDSLDMAIKSLETDEAYQLEYESTTKNDHHRQNIQAYMHDFGVSEEQAEKELRVTTKNDLAVSNGLENGSPIIDWNNCHTSEQLENPTKKYCGCCKYWKRKGVKKIGDKPTSYGKCTKLSISGFEVETTYNDDCSSEGLE